MCLYLTPTTIYLFSQKNNVKDQISLKFTDKTRKKVLDIDLKDIKTNVRENEAIILTVNNPKFNFQIKNYKELLNVKITFDGKLLQLINHDNGFILY